MTKENIIVPRWFLEDVENTLRIQNNINLDKETGETCQDRNVRQSLNGLRKLLKGEELTGRERFERLQPSLPSDLDEAAEEYIKFKPRYDIQEELEEGEDPTEIECFTIDAAIDAFKDGAEWMAGQGASYNTKVGWIDGPTVLDWPDDILDKFEMGDEVIVQIRKKQ